MHLLDKLFGDMVYLEMGALPLTMLTGQFFNSLINRSVIVGVLEVYCANGLLLIFVEVLEFDERLMIKALHHTHFCEIIVIDKFFQFLSCFFIAVFFFDA